MNLKVLNEKQIQQEVFETLLKNMDFSKFLRFWSGLNLGQGDYLQLKDEIFAQETMETLYAKIVDHQEEMEGSEGM
jgi:hypothetical protein